MLNFFPRMQYRLQSNIINNRYYFLDKNVDVSIFSTENLFAFVRSGSDEVAQYFIC